jgi:hypothetical protein
LFSVRYEMKFCTWCRSQLFAAQNGVAEHSGCFSSVTIAKQLPTFRKVVTLLSLSPNILRLLCVFKFILAWWYFHHMFAFAVVFMFILLPKLMACMKTVTVCTCYLHAALLLTVTVPVCRVFNFWKHYDPRRHSVSNTLSFHEVHRSVTSVSCLTLNSVY